MKWAELHEPHSMQTLTDSHVHFDPVEKYKGNFKRLTAVEFTTITKKFIS